MGTDVEKSKSGGTAIAVANPLNSKYSKAVTDALKIKADVHSVTIGTIKPMSSLPILERIVDERRDFLEQTLRDPIISNGDRSIQVSVAKLMPMTFAAYLEVVSGGKYSSMDQEAFSRVYNRRIHTPNLQGYATYQRAYVLEVSMNEYHSILPKMRDYLQAGRTNEMEEVFAPADKLVRVLVICEKADMRRQYLDNLPKRRDVPPAEEVTWKRLHFKTAEELNDGASFGESWLLTNGEIKSLPA